MDQAVPFSMRLFVQFTALFIGFLSIVVVTSYLTIIIVPVVLFYYYIQKYYITTVRELRQISSVSMMKQFKGYLTILSFGKRIRNFN